MKTKRLFLVLCLLCLVISLGILSASAATIVSSGKCGENVKWKLDSAGTFTVYGKGEMYNYCGTEGLEGYIQGYAPWYAQRESIKKVVFENGVTTVGTRTFESCTNITSVTFNDSIVTIGNFAFMDATNLREVELPAKLQSLGQQAFCRTSLERIELPATITFLDACVFTDCKALKEAVIYGGGEMGAFVIGNSVFLGCTSLEKITLVGEHLSLQAEDGVLYGVDYLQDYPAGRKDPVFRVREGTISIGQFAADSAVHLETLILPKTLEGIGVFAFGHCENLTTIFFNGNAPTILEYAFLDVTATCYYPANDPTWTKDVRQDYNGNLTWVPYGGTATITRQPKTTYTKLNGTAKVTVKASGDGLTYTWYFKNAGASKFSKSSVTSATYSAKMTDKVKNRQVYCVVKDKYGNEVKTSTVYLRQAASIVTQPKTTYTKLNGTAKVTVKASGDGLTYTWYFKNAGASKFSKSSITSATYSTKMTSTQKNRQVYCVVKDKYGNTVKTTTVYLRQAASIVTQPKTTYTKLGGSAKVTVKASGDGLTYTWYFKNAGSTKFTKSSVTSATYSTKMTSTTKDRQVYCVVKDKYGNTVKTETVRLRMAASISKQPVNVTAAKGAKATVKLTAKGDGLTYKWYYKDAGGKTFKLTTSFKSSTYSLTMSKSNSGRQVYCVVTDKYGNSVKSNVVTLKMK